MNLGITGTRSGLSRRQRIEAERLLAELSPEWLHHGDCRGVDAQLHEMARHSGIKVKVHPPDGRKLRAWCEGDETAEPKPYLTRNHAIVNEVDTMLAFPDGLERLHSGTWATVRYARKRGVHVIVVHPGGQYE